jgi:hypothetical protein
MSDRRSFAKTASFLAVPLSAPNELLAVPIKL